jgi:hypothetical protein
MLPWSASARSFLHKQVILSDTPRGDEQLIDLDAIVAGLELG